MDEINANDALCPEGCRCEYAVREDLEMDV